MLELQLEQQNNSFTFSPMLRPAFVRSTHIKQPIRVIVAGAGVMK